MLFSTNPSARLLAAAMAVAVLAVPAAADVLNSNLQIDPGQTFELGGGQKGGFTVTGRNVGPVAVVVYGLAEGATAPVIRGTVAPGGAVDATFGPGEQALLRNTSTMEMARLKLKVSGDISALGMTYSANP
ncbi:hypothetical protein ACLBKU_10950 [Erythrobacter sp. NE805]|uniref:hypothetical protein n=1 Tax=Erythrobacter sp. NE805 TaxID=3389875 RepID=UPI00396AF779